MRLPPGSNSVPRTGCRARMWEDTGRSTPGGGHETDHRRRGTSTRSGTVLVVGGGATGVGVCRDLALRGLDVVLVDRGGLASGTSGRSHGLLHSGARYAESDPTGAKECRAENRILRSIGGARVRDIGGLFVQMADDDAAYFDQKRTACTDAGIRTELLDGDAARDLVPDLAGDVVDVVFLTKLSQEDLGQCRCIRRKQPDIEELVRCWIDSVDESETPVRQPEVVDFW